MKRKQFISLVLPLVLTFTGCTLFTANPHPNPNSNPSPSTASTTVVADTTDPSYSNPPTLTNPNQLSHADERPEGSTTVTTEDPAPSESTDTNSTADGSASGTFYTLDLYGNEYTEKVFAKASINVVNVWGTFCGPCIAEMPDLGELSHEYDPSDVQFIGIVSDVYSLDDAEAKDAIEIINDTGADYLHLICSYDVYYWQLEGMEYVPTTMIIDEYGNILYTTVGSMSKDEWKSLIDSYVK